MKVFNLLAFAALLLHPGVSRAEWSAEDRRLEKEQLDLWEGRLSNAEAKEP